MARYIGPKCSSAGVKELICLKSRFALLNQMQHGEKQPGQTNRPPPDVCPITVCG